MKSSDSYFNASIGQKRGSSESCDFHFLHPMQLLFFFLNSLFKFFLILPFQNSDIWETRGALHRASVQSVARASSPGSEREKQPDETLCLASLLQIYLLFQSIYFVASFPYGLGPQVLGSLTNRTSSRFRMIAKPNRARAVASLVCHCPLTSMTSEAASSSSELPPPLLPPLLMFPPFISTGPRWPSEPRPTEGEKEDGEDEQELEAEAPW